MPVVEVFADVWCPFTHVGLKRFVARRSELGRSDVGLRVRAWPLEVVNGEPLDAGFVAEEVEGIRSAVAADLFTGFDPANFPSTSLPALALAAAAYERDLTTGEVVSLELRDLLFEQGLDVADDEVLGRVAGRHGLTVEARHHERVLEDHRAGLDRGVTGSPHFFTGSGDFFCPSLEVGRDDDGDLVISADPAGFEHLAAAAFS